MLMVLLCFFLVVLLPVAVVVVIRTLSGSCAHSGVVVSGKLKTNFNSLKGTHGKHGTTHIAKKFWNGSAFLFWGFCL